jgi:hypothetical protein
MSEGLSGVITWLGLGLALAISVWRVVISLRVAADARARGWSRLSSAGWALGALVYRGWYWWQARLERLTRPEAQAVLAAQTKAHRLADVRNIRCPLCDAEMENVLTVTPSDTLGVRSLAHCPRCDFRLDACRHCWHFLPSEDGIAGQKNFTTGRCGLYRAPQPVQQAFPLIARRLEAMGYDTLNAPQVILDSFVPLEECTGFAPSRERLRVSRIPWLNRQRVALIQLHHKYFERAR